MKLFSTKERPVHLGKYPMERIKRVDRPTTRIDAGRIPRVPKRANFFTRALHGDLGPKPAQERARFVAKYPIAEAMAEQMKALVPLQDGPVAPDKAPIPEGLDERAAHVKSLCYFLDADMVGICAIPDHAWYSHHEDGRPIGPYHTYAIVMLIDQGFETMEGASGDDWISGTQSFRGYLRGCEIANVVASYIRKLGWSARCHSNADSDVLHIPLILEAGLGELSRIGELVLNPFVGPRFKSVVVTTDLALATDKPIDFGLQDVCSKCTKCAVECPCRAISFGGKVMFNGYEMWKPDAETCTRYRVTNPNGSGCGRCMKMCPYNNEGLMAHRVGLWFAINAPWSRRLLIWLDGVLGYGTINKIKTWWWDLETVAGKVVRPKDTNRRTLKPRGEAVAGDRKIAYYPASAAPPPGHKGPWPVDRKAALAVEPEKP